MSRRKAKAKPLPPDWIVSTEATLNGRRVVRGTELRIRGERGRFRFLQLVERPERGYVWIDVWGGTKHNPAFRSFALDRVKTVHRIATTPENLLALRKSDKSTLKGTK